MVRELRSEHFDYKGRTSSEWLIGRIIRMSWTLYSSIQLVFFIC